MEEFIREELMIGKENVEKLKNKKVIVFGIGGVGSYVVEGLARAGIGKFILVDSDVVSMSNINRQLIALHSTVGMDKVEVAKNRILDINPNAEVVTYKKFFGKITEIKFADNNCINNKYTNNKEPNNEYADDKYINNENVNDVCTNNETDDEWINDLFDESVSYIVDAIDSVSSKIELIVRSQKAGIPIISCMGTGNKLDSTKFEITDISKTSVCPLAKVMRKELKVRGIKKVKVLYSKEEPIKKFVEENNKRAPGSISFVPSVAGLIIAGEVVKDLIK